MIPIYRAKRLDSDEYEIDLLKEKKQSDGTHIAYTLNGYHIDPNTLAIHMDGMIDKNSKKIFASLSKNGVGGDEVIYKLHEDKKAISVARYKDNQFHYCQNTVEVIGIHKGETLLES